jgi:hypothetical protein
VQLAWQWIKASHTVLIGAKFSLSEKNLKLANQISEDSFASTENTVKQFEVVLITTPPIAIFEVI